MTATGQRIFLLRRASSTCIALRQLREPDAFPAADIGLMRALASLERRKYSLSELLDRAGAPMPRNTYGLRPERRYCPRLGSLLICCDAMLPNV
jgi:hypothetical protein